VASRVTSLATSAGSAPQARSDRKYRAVIDRRYRLADVIEATAYVETKQKTGNVVLTIGT
jgi:NADPH:quinone reductase-like Zn-dependent oxidoreductase